MKNRVALLLCLDTAMLLLVCVLECINFTGLEWHQWLGFAFCPVVLLHVVLQWQWFITQFRRMFTLGAWRVRVNAGLNLLLLVMMAAVLFSGVFVSRQATAWVGEGFGRVRLWSEVHGWLNFVLVVLVGLHLALNWDWMIAALRRRRPGRPGLATERTRGNVAQSSPAGSPGVPPGVAGIGTLPQLAAGTDCATRPARRGIGFAGWLGRAVAVLLVASVASGAVYFSMKAMLYPKWRAAMERQRIAAANATGREGNQPAPRPTEPARTRLAPRDRPARLRDAPNVAGTLALTLLVAVIGRYVFRLRL